MFKVYEIKNKNRRGLHAKKYESIAEDQLVARRPDERTVAYYSVVPEQFRKHHGYRLLTWQHKGLFRILCDELWCDGGKLVNLDFLTAQRLEISEDEWVSAKRQFIQNELLIEINSGNELLQPELREQYLQFIATNSRD